ncbi:MULTISPECIES: flagellar hook-associated protein FlgL [unclassified Variovorax]|uniref:flagellar hook-associated protein FlgL n=1 Tax=unclassified Variovorax TaxID=663243 RepID=UPI00076C65DA|nr:MULTISPECIES: flagellar hook-associated protein FlgL [unclassified Variovorax]KWT91935.1 Flagellar hook-associated protein FlgL [Variovorax sp. WDL1]PNG46876.1 Flagellar hook-associated protein 3 [Variovorax sp. B2]PNG48473.1 Flagellar hook-associated protein 3 [Variovorax sp. B4]VTV14701.1 Hook-filament junction protein [Variovorax sp. WDL1]
MRISTQSFYARSMNDIGSQQQQLFRIQQQLAAQSKFLTPADDPVASARALGVSDALAQSSQYATSRGRATLSLSREEDALKSATEILQNVKTMIVQAGNGTLSDADRASLATAMQSNLDQLVNVANADDGNGQFLFAGYKSANPPFVAQAGGGVQYMGDQGQRLIQVDVARQMSAADDGRSVFQSVQGSAGYVTSASAANTGSGVFGGVGVTDASAALYGKDFNISFAGGNYTVTTSDTPPVVAATGAYTPGTPIAFAGVQLSMSGTPADGDSFRVATAKNAGTDVFAAIGDMISALRQPLADGGAAAQARLQNALSTANVKITNAHDNVLTIRSSVGSRMNEIDALDDAGASRDLIDKSYLSDLQDLDPAAAISEFLQRQTSLQATQQTFARLHGISLFNYL